MVDYNTIKKKLIRICKTKKKSKKSKRFSLLSWNTKKGHILLTDEDTKNFYDIINEFFKDNFIIDNFSKTYIHELLQNAITLIVEKKPSERDLKIKNEIIRIKRKINEKLQEKKFIIPLINITISKKYLTIGNVKIYKFNEFRKKSALKKLKNIIFKNSIYSKEQKEKQFQDRKHFFDKFKDKYVAEIKVKGTKKESPRIALRKVRNALSILKLYNYMNDKFYKRFFGIEGEIVSGFPRLTFSYNDKQFNMSASSIGSNYKFEIDKDRLKFMKNNCFKKLSLLLKKENLTDFEKRILTSIYWYSETFDIAESELKKDKIEYLKRSQEIKNEIESIDVSEGFLKQVIALECLLLFERESKQINLSERCAFILSKKYLDRKQIKTYVKRIYDLRSKIVHEGNTVVSNKDLLNLTNFVQNVLITIIKRKDKLKIKTNNNLKEWFEKQKMSS